MAFVNPVDYFSYRGVVYSPESPVDDGEEVVRRYPTMFGLDPVERATARPGEKRDVRRPAKKAAKKAVAPKSED